MTVAVHLNGYVHGLEERSFVNAGKDEVAFVKGFGSLGGGADAHGGDGFAYRQEEAALLGKCTGVTHHGEGVHLQIVVVMEAEGLVGYHTAVEFEAALFKAFARAGMAAVEDGHVVLLGHGVDGVEERQEVLLGVDVLLAVGRQKDIFALLKTEAAENVARFDFGQVVVENFRHGRTADISALRCHTRCVEIAAGML